MTDRTLFRSFVLADVGVLAGQGLWTLAAPGGTDPEPTSMWLSPVAVIPLLVLGLVAIISIIGLFLFWRPARPLYVVSLLGGIVAAAFDTRPAAIGVQGALASLNMLLAGVVIGLMYFSPARREFEPISPDA
jgi:hypothetical protein